MDSQSGGRVEVEEERMRESGMQGRTDEGKIGRRSEGASGSAEPVPCRHGVGLQLAGCTTRTIHGRVAICHFPLSRCSAFHLSCSHYPFLRLPICTPLLTLVTLHRHLLSDINIFNRMYFFPVPSACIPSSDLGSSLQVATQPKTGTDSGRFTLQ